jgi:AcrR family transcriptional regulator
MNDKQDTASRLVAAAVELFSQHGFDGTSVRTITSAAGANLGAITYHFGSKGALYEAAFASVVEPLRAFAVEAAMSPGPPLRRIERTVRTFFHYLGTNPEFPNLISHQLASARPLPEAVRNTMRKNIQTMVSVIAEGQGDGSIRTGDPRDMALSIIAQPMWFTLARRTLQEGADLDQDDPDAYEQVVESVVQFVREGLRKHRED